MKQILFALALAFMTNTAFPADDTRILAVQAAQIQRQQAEIQKNTQALAELAAKNNPTTIIQQIQAQATCTALRPNGGWVFAVTRSNGATSCRQLCSGLREDQAGVLSCFNSLHIYAGNNPSTANEAIGLKTHLYNSCDNLSFGPNYCCCGNP